jgi:hypothetical protein
MSGDLKPAEAAHQPQGPVHSVPPAQLAGEVEWSLGTPAYLE